MEKKETALETLREMAPMIPGTYEIIEKKEYISGQKSVFQFQGTKYQMTSVGSIIELVQRKGSIENTVIFYNDNAVKVILDDRTMDRPQDEAAYYFEKSPELKDWMNLFGAPIGQKDFVNFLKQRNFVEVSNLDDLLARVQKLKIATQIMGDYAYDDNNNYTVMFKTKDSEDQVKMPSVINVWLPLINESEKKFSIEVEMELIKPKDENEKPKFRLTCNKFQQYWREAVEDEVNILHTSLDGYLILTGSPK